MSTAVSMNAEADKEVRERNRVTLGKLILIVPVMLVFCGLMVPLYKQICAALGVSATRAVLQNTQVDFSRKVAVDFVANLNADLPWKFEPVDKHVEINPGAITTINYRVTNTLSHAVTGRAVPSFAPAESGRYFQKFSCFCFSNQTLQAGETRDMPVVFLVDPKMPKEIEAIALSYTFFDVSEQVKS